MSFNPLKALQIPKAPKKEKSPPKTPQEKKAEYESGKRLLESERMYRKGMVTLRDLIAPAAFVVRPDHVRLNSLFVRSLFVSMYPRYLSVGWFSPIINFSAPLDVAMYF